MEASHGAPSLNTSNIYVDARGQEHPHTHTHTLTHTHPNTHNHFSPTNYEQYNILREMPQASFNNIPHSQPTSGMSPLKSRIYPHPLPQVPQPNLSFHATSPVMMAAPQQPAYQTDSLHKPQMQHDPFIQQSLNHNFQQYNHAHFDKENIYQPHHINQASSYIPHKLQPTPSHSYSQINTRQEPKDRPIAPLRDRSKKKKSSTSVPANPTESTAATSDQKEAETEVEASFEDFDLNNLPMFEDDGNKPPLSYSSIICLALLKADKHKLTLANIYSWIQDNFSYYRRAQDAGWQNSVRHNLSLHKGFVKEQRPKDDPGKGCYWTVLPKELHTFGFLKEKPKTGFATMTTKRQSISRPAPPAIDSSKFPDEEELSSDATIPASDPAIHEGVSPENDMPPPSKFRSSPPPQITSSPPQMPSSIREGTPPAVGRFAIPNSKANGGRKSKISLSQSGMGDSGYFSSIESSAPRNSRVYLTSELDSGHPANKSGRAEEEIARIRHSSYDSPSKTRLNPGYLVSSSPYKPKSSAPLKRAPLTPGHTFKRPAQVPMSVSPNTNLRNHREEIQRMLGSPDKSLSIMESPCYAWPNHSTETAQYCYPEVLMDSPLRPKIGISPERRGQKRSGLSLDYGVSTLKRPRFERSATTAGIVAERGSKFEDLKHVPSLQPKLKSPVQFQMSPVKKGDSARYKFSTLEQVEAPAIGKAISNDTNSFDFALNLPSDDSEAGVDIFQGFERIGVSGGVSGYIDSMQENLMLSGTNINLNSGNDERPSLGRSASAFM